MKESSFNLSVRVIVVGNETDSFTRYVTNLLGDHNIEFFLCQDVYDTISKILKNTNSDTVVIGRLMQLSRAGESFFSKISENGTLCCCFADSDSPRKLTAARQAGAFILNRLTDIDWIVTQLLESDYSGISEEKINENEYSFNKEDFLITQREIDALLGAEAIP